MREWGVATITAGKAIESLLDYPGRLDEMRDAMREELVQGNDIEGFMRYLDMAEEYLK